MFTGIIREIGVIEEKKKNPTGGISVFIKSRKLRPQTGGSVAVNGVCLTAARKTRSGFWTDAMPETLLKTNLGSLRLKSKVNLEPSLKMRDSLDGHFVTGHVDAAVPVIKKEKNERGTLLTVELPVKLRRLIVEKSSVAINGVSLTVVYVKPKSLTAALIPFTEKHTNLGEIEEGEFVNMEVDLIARYLKSTN